MKSQHFLPQLLTSTSALDKVTRVFQHLVVRQVELIEQEQIRERVGRQGDEQVFIQQQTHGVVREAGGNLRTETPEQVKEAEYQFNALHGTDPGNRGGLQSHPPPGCQSHYTIQSMC